jgi:NAD-dependent SIR2 family protein deacetylase
LELDLGAGFWGSSFNKYREVKPHDGYQIVRQWRDQRFVDTFYMLTSNVDAHWRRAGIKDTEVCEVYTTNPYGPFLFF